MGNKIEIFPFRRVHFVPTALLSLVKYRIKFHILFKKMVIGKNAVGERQRIIMLIRGDSKIWYVFLLSTTVKTFEKTIFYRVESWIWSNLVLTIFKTYPEMQALSWCIKSPMTIKWQSVKVADFRCSGGTRSYPVPLCRTQQRKTYIVHAPYIVDWNRSVERLYWVIQGCYHFI